MFCVARELKARRSSCCYLLTITTTGDTDGDTGIVGQTPLLRSTFSPAWSTDTPWPYLGNLSKTYKFQVPELVRFYSQTHTIILTLINTASYKRKLHKYIEINFVICDTWTPFYVSELAVLPVADQQAAHFAAFLHLPRKEFACCSFAQMVAHNNLSSLTIFLLSLLSC